MVHDKSDTLGNVIKRAREKEGMTIEKLSEKVGVTTRYIYRIENEGKKPSFDVLNKLIHVLSINSESIFYPDKYEKDSEIDALLRILANCDERTLNTIKIIAKDLADNQTNK